MIRFMATALPFLWLVAVTGPCWCASVRPRSVSDLITKTEVERMTIEQFQNVVDQRAKGRLLNYDDATFYYAEVKEALHDRQAARVSPSMLSKLRWIRGRILAAERSVISANEREGTIYYHTCNWTGMQMEDAVGDVLRVLMTHRRHKRSARRLLRKLAALDYRISGNGRPYHKLAKEFAVQPYGAVRVVLKQEAYMVDTILVLRSLTDPLPRRRD
jgi:hypothetical protein